VQTLFWACSAVPESPSFKADNGLEPFILLEDLQNYISAYEIVENTMPSITLLLKTSPKIGPYQIRQESNQLRGSNPVR
jgi:hypothetical protein